jgi:hypothetical protein
MNLLRQLKDGRCDEFPGGMSTELILISHVHILRKSSSPLLICRARLLRATLACLASRIYMYQHLAGNVIVAVHLPGALPARSAGLSRLSRLTAASVSRRQCYCRHPAGQCIRRHCCRRPALPVASLRRPCRTQSPLTFPSFTWRLPASFSWRLPSSGPIWRSSLLCPIIKDCTCMLGAVPLFYGFTTCFPGNCRIWLFQSRTTLRSHFPYNCQVLSFPKSRTCSMIAPCIL